MQIYDNLRSIRILLGLKQISVATQLGVSQNVYSRLERGKINITESKKEALSKIFGLSFQEIQNFHLTNSFISAKTEIKSLSNSQDGDYSFVLIKREIDGLNSIIKLSLEILNVQQKKLDHLEALLTKCL